MKRIQCVLTALSIMIFLLPLSLSAAPADTVIENLSAFHKNFSVSTGDIIGALRSAFTAKPQLVFYYNGMSYTVFSGRTDCEVAYINTDTAIDSVRVVDSTDGLYDCLRAAMLNAETDVNVVLSGGKNLDLDLSEMIDRIQDRDYIAFMGYGGMSLQKFSNNHSDAAAYKIAFSYGYDSATLIRMKQEAKAEVAWLASAVFTPDMSEYDLVKSIHDYLIDNTVYDDGGGQLVFYAYGPLIKGTGVCEGYAQAARLLFDAVGIESLFVSGTVDDNISHTWNIVKIGGNWYQLDVTWDDPITPDGKNNKTYDYFNITDAEMALDHVWSGDYPKCTAADRGVNATKTAVRTPSAESEPSVGSSSISKSAQHGTPTVPSKPFESASAVSLRESSAASLPPQSATSSDASNESAIESPSPPVLPIFPPTASRSAAEQPGFQPSELIAALSENIGLSVPIVTTLLFSLLAALTLFIVYSMLRKK